MVSEITKCDVMRTYTISEYTRNTRFENTRLGPRDIQKKSTQHPSCPAFLPTIFEMVGVLPKKNDGRPTKMLVV